MRGGGQRVGNRRDSGRGASPPGACLSASARSRSTRARSASRVGRAAFVARSQKNVRHPNGRLSYTEQRPRSERSAQTRSRAASPESGNARRFGDRAPPRARTARSTAAASMLVTYGSRPVTPNRQHSVDVAQVLPAWSASASAKIARSSPRSASSCVRSPARGSRFTIASCAARRRAATSRSETRVKERLECLRGCGRKKDACVLRAMRGPELQGCCPVVVVPP